MSSKGTTIRERITALEVTVADNKTELNMKIDGNQKILIDKIDGCKTSLDNHLQHVADRNKDLTDRNRQLFIALLIVVTPYIIGGVGYGLWKVVEHVFLGR